MAGVGQVPRAVQGRNAGPPLPPGAAHLDISMPDSQQQRHTTPGQAQNTFTLTHCLCFQFSAFCWVALAARVCQGWVLGVLARQVPTVGKPTPLTILCKPAYKAGPVGANKTTNIVPGGVGDTNAPPPKQRALK